MTLKDGLERLAALSETCRMDYMPDICSLSEEEQKIARLIDRILRNNKAAVEYDLMKYRLASDALGVAHWDMQITDSDTPLSPDSVFIWSREFRRMLGYTDETDFPNMVSSWSDRLHPEDRERVLSALRAHLSDRTGNTPYQMVYRIATKTGEYRHFRSFGTTLRDENGVPLRVAGATKDVTNEIDYQRMLESVLNGMEALIAVTTPGDCKVLFLNDAMRECFGIEGSGVGEYCYKLLQKRDEPCEGCPYQQLTEAQDMTIVWDHREFIEGRVLHKTARLIDWPGGQKAHLEYAIDITALLDAEVAIEHREAMLGALNGAAAIFLSQSGDDFTETMSKGFEQIAAIADIDRMSVYRNTVKSNILYGSQIYRWRKEIGTADALDERLQDIPYAKVIPSWTDVLAKGGCVNGPVRAMPEAEFLGRMGCLSMLAVPVFDDGEFWGFIVFEDIHNERVFNADEVDILRSASFMLMNAVTSHETEERVKAADEYTKLMLDATPFSCILWDTKHQVIDCNETALALLGFSGKEECAERILGCFPDIQPDGGNSHALIHQYIYEAFEKGRCQFEWMFTTLTGEDVPTAVTLTRIKHGDEYLVAAYARDLRHRRMLMGEISRQNMLLQAVNKVSSIMLSSQSETFNKDLTRSLEVIAEAVDIDRVYLWKNQNKNGALSYTRLHEWSGSAEFPVGEAVTREVSLEQEWYYRLSQNLCVGSVVKDLPEAERDYLSARGVKSIFIVPIFLYDAFWGFVGYDDCRDERDFLENEETILRAAGELIAEALVRYNMEEDLRESSARLQRALLEAEAANAAKSEFLSSMSHEMRTPLNAVIGMTAIGKRSGDKERKDYALDRIEDASTHLLGVINDILDMSKIEAGKLELSPVEFNLERMLQKVMTVITNRVNEKQQQLSVQIGKDVPRFVVGDDQRIAQIITNLLANATKFTPEGGQVALQISLLSEEDGINEIRVEVTDTGIGITPEQQAKLFQSFTQAEGGISREFGGTGLGLSISRRLVEMMGGRIWVESEAGKGASFLFTVKLPGGANNLRSLLDTGVNWDSVRVLVADGSEAVLQSFRDSFERLGVHCETAADGASASRMVTEQGPYDICFIDWHIPGMDGTELARSIKASEGSGVVVLISSMDWERLQEAVRDAGADRGLSKPLLASALVDCMNECLGNPYEKRKTENANEFAGKSMLLAEDIEINQEIVTSLLEGTGLRIDCVGNGEEAAALMELSPGKYDVILMDMQMPIMDGLEATRRIRAFPSAWCKRVPIIAMTANVFKSDIEHCIAAGMNDHIGKPIDYSDMTAKLRKYLFGKQYAREPGSMEEYADELGNGVKNPAGLVSRNAALTPGASVTVEIWSLDESGNEKTVSLSATVGEVYPGSLFFLCLESCRDAEHPITRGEILSVYFTPESTGDVRGEPLVLTSRLVEKTGRDGRVYVLLEAVGKPEPSQRRGSRRLPLSICVSMRRVRGIETSSFDARMINFSDSGMLISTDENLDVGENITLEFNIERRETVNGTVLRTAPAENEGFRYEAAISFERATQEQKERFLQYIRERSQGE